MRSDWQFARLDTVVDFYGGGTPSRQEMSFWGGDIPWVSPKDMKCRDISTSIDSITQKAVEKSATRMIPAGALLIVVRSGILARTIPVALTRRALAINQDIKALCPSDAVSATYLRYFFEARERAILALVTRGATVHRLKTESLKSLVIPLPPLADQKRIVAILDEAVGAIDGVNANNEKNLSNARQLFQNYRTTSLRRIRETWGEQPLGTLVRLMGGGTPSKENPRFWGGDIPWVSPKDMKSRGITSSLDGITEEAVQQSAARMIPSGALLIVVRSGILARTIPVAIAERSLTINQDLKALVPSGAIKPEFLRAFLESHEPEILGMVTRGATVHRLQTEALKSIKVPVPPLEEQERLVKTFTAAGDLVRALGDVYSERQTKLVELRDSIFQKAFTGELTLDFAERRFAGA